MTGAKVVLLCGLAMQGVLAEVPNPGGGIVDVYKTGGIVAVLLVLLAVVYLDGRRQREKSETVMAALADSQVKQAEATTKHADATQRQAEAVFQMSQIIRHCATQRGVASAPQAPDVRPPT